MNRYLVTTPFGTYVVEDARWQKKSSMGPLLIGRYKLAGSDGPWWDEGAFRVDTASIERLHDQMELEAA